MVVAIIVIILYEWIIVEVVHVLTIHNLNWFLIENLTFMSFTDFEICVVATIWLLMTGHISSLIHEVHRRSVSWHRLFLLFVGKTRSNNVLLRDLHEARRWHYLVSMSIIPPNNLFHKYLADYVGFCALVIVV